MFLDKFRDRYSFNILTISGWLLFVLFLFLGFPDFFQAYIIGKTEHVFGFGVSLLITVLFSIILIFLCLTIFIIEKYMNIRKINNRLLQNKTFIKFQTTGFILFFVPILILSLIIIHGIILDIIVKFKSITHL